MHARCCGIAGTYGLKDEKYDIAMEVGAALFDHVAIGAGDGRLRQRNLPLADRARHRAAPVHPIELLHRAYGLAAARARGRSASSSSPTAQALAEGVVALAREMGGEKSHSRPQAGPTSRSAGHRRRAGSRGDRAAMSDDGVLVLMDLVARS